MSNDSATRRLLPQSAQMGSFSFAPQQTYQQPRETQKSALIPRVLVVLANPIDYVFVDEHNRHKRLKGERVDWERPFEANTTQS